MSSTTRRVRTYRSRLTEEHVSVGHVDSSPWLDLTYTAVVLDPWQLKLLDQIPGLEQPADNVATRQQVDEENLVVYDG
jgi:hypothetical protein